MDGRERQAARGRGMTAPQQEARQREEHRHRQIETAEQPTVDPAGVPGVKRDVGDDDADRRAGAHSFDRGQEAASAADLLARVYAPLFPASRRCPHPVAWLCIVAGGRHGDSLPGEWGTPDLPTVRR